MYANVYLVKIWSKFGQKFGIPLSFIDAGVNLAKGWGVIFELSVKSGVNLVKTWANGSTYNGKALIS